MHLPSFSRGLHEQVKVSLNFVGLVLLLIQKWYVDGAWYQCAWCDNIASASRAAECYWGADDGGPGAQETDASLATVRVQSPREQQHEDTHRPRGCQAETLWTGGVIMTDNISLWQCFQSPPCSLLGEPCDRRLLIEHYGKHPLRMTLADIGSEGAMVYVIVSWIFVSSK